MSAHSFCRGRTLYIPLLIGLAATMARAQDTSPGPKDRGPRPMLVGNLSRPLRYTPEGTDFVIKNGDQLFNRPLYGSATPFRVDAGDRPEFSFYLPGRGGNLRLGLETPRGAKWLNQADSTVARYRPGSMIYEIRDPMLGTGTIEIVALAPRVAEGVVLRVVAHDIPASIQLVCAYGGMTGERGSRDGDIGTERSPVREYFQLLPEYTRDNKVALEPHGFIVSGRVGRMKSILPPEAQTSIADASAWNDIKAFLASSSPQAGALPIALARIPLVSDRPQFLALEHLRSESAPSELLATYQEVAAERKTRADTGPEVIWNFEQLPGVFAAAEADRAAIAGRVSIQTPDAYMNAAVAALNVAADAVWDDRQEAYLHGGVAWRVRLLGWRVSYVGDALGWHERTQEHFDGYAAQQNTSPVADHIAPAEESANLARNENALHSNGDLTHSHYDMNLVGVDAILRHLLWTGDLDYARKIWPVLERHLAWERRLFRREYGPEKLPLYEAYCCIWASDALEYNGGGAAHSTAYNLYQNRVAARVARLIGADPQPYIAEAALIERAMEKYLWLGDRGWFAEWRDLLGKQLAHPNAAGWTFYHTVDEEVPTPLEAWQMSRFVDTQLPHIPVMGPGVPTGNYTVPTTTWMPYVWSLNNVVLAESSHTALALWQAGRTDAAYPLLKGALLDSMYLGISPGNVGMSTWYDVNRRESQRDFGDGIGTLSRTIVQGLFGVVPDLLAGEVVVRPGFPAAWTKSSMHHPDFDFDFNRAGDVETYKFISRFPHPIGLRLQVPAWRDDIANLTVNGQPAAWHAITDSVGIPRIELAAPAAGEFTVVIHWRGHPPASAPSEAVVAEGAAFTASAGVNVTSYIDPQGAAQAVEIHGTKLSGRAVGTVGHRALFARVNQGGLSWWQPVMLDIHEAHPAAPQVFTTDWTKPLGKTAKLEAVPIYSIFNDQVANIFRHEYLAPRSPFDSLAVPKQGFSSWTAPTTTFVADDTGLRAQAARGGDKIVLPNGVPLSTPGDGAARNIAFVSQWKNFPDELSLPLTGRASKIYLLMAGSTWAMQSRFVNGELVFNYTDGTVTTVALENPSTWWPIHQDYFIDDFAYARPGPLPVRVDLRSGNIRVLDAAKFAGQGRTVPGGAATVLDISLDPKKELKSMTVRAIANEVVIGLMSATLQRP